MLYGLWKSKQEKESEFLTEQIIKETAFINELKSKYQGDFLGSAAKKMALPVKRC